ncbi:tetratricopeptide repeat protein [Paraburkholderia guartelaensis]|uniref:tetratricopeptide repeat protein n=1 Tax=Paraburkholderia guartelaensis TaxID=2546446 RepID=UPI002AB7AEE7|nr:tetratricopeptide repeat protein [Paraburkholderia guartelaensis]
MSEAALVHFRGDAALHFNRAIAFEKLGRFEDTEQNYKHCLELDSLYADVRRNLAIQLERDVAIHGAWSVI